jgi:secondary thiamine-phosphate synthase enzyme
MRQAVDILSISTRGRGLVEITRDVLNWLEPHPVQAGLLTLFCRHSSAGLLIQENAARDVRADLETFFDRLAPEDASRYRHADEGPDDMPAHIRTALIGVQLAIPIVQWELALGTWQGIYLFEHRRAPHRRQIALHLIVNDGGRIGHRSKARSPAAVLAKSRGANAFRFLWMKLQ